MLMASPAGVASLFVTRASPVLIEAVAGPALFGAKGVALLAALKHETGRMPALVAFLMCASGVTRFGFCPVFQGLVPEWGTQSFPVPRFSP